MAYSYYRPLTLDHTKIPNTDLTNFTVLISGTYTYLKTVGNGGSVQNSSGYDVAFFSDSALTTQLKHETVKYTASTGAVIYRVKVPTASHTSDTVIYLAYGDSSISTDQSDAANAWDANTKAIYHLEDGTTLSVADALATFNGTNNGATAATGQVGGGASLNGSSNYIDLGSSSTLKNLASSSFSFSCWIKPTTLDSTDRIIVGNGYSTAGWHIRVTTGNLLRFIVITSGSIYRYADSSSLSTNTWYHVAGTWDGTSAKLYVNGSIVATNTGSAGTMSTNISTLNTYLGNVSGASQFFAGVLDEAKIIAATRSADWIAAEYNNENSPSTFYTVGSEVTTIPPVYDMGMMMFGL